ncbi:Outer membrane protein assembly factor BamB [Candidatus Erwinia haradaeae]|uniref:Outer membrane protein assembly factor BamB n=1 Tax=Candidatus Erwinia haradaeae TaxID=1922217 RepID=A0A451DIX3_9GAMM|nr:outer membrane protein assembly factor BamB [Candidatus Erwinia haradaeae]VFP86667.1 Outer membrane protein assembly factor BamB [Candidatus Erwinia haradaeae]
MIFIKLLARNCVLLALLNGCSWFSGTDNFEEISILPKIHNQFNPEKIWSTNIGNDVSHFYSNLRPGYSNNTVYAADRNGIVKALNAVNGKEKWKVNLSDHTSFFSANRPALLAGGVTLNSNYIYIGTERATVFALNRDDGSIAWKTNVMGEVLSAPVVSDNLVLVHTSNGLLQALDQFNGVVKWSVHLEVPKFSLRGQSSPATTCGTAIVGGDNGSVSAILINQGQIIWQQRIAYHRSITGAQQLSDVDTTPLIINGVVYALAYNGDLAALDIQSGHVLWHRYISSIHDMITDDEKHIFLVDQDDRLLALNMDNGTQIWQQNSLLHRHLTPPILYHKNLVVGDSKGYLHWVNPKNGAIMSRQKLDNTGFQAKPLVTKESPLFIIQSKSGKVHALMH